jgi:hypothetical protein
LEDIHTSIVYQNERFCNGCHAEQQPKFVQIVLRLSVRS